MIGSWVRRVRLGPIRPVTLWHRVESEIADRLVVRCGKELKSKRELPFEFELLPVVADRCYWCDR